jgi:hypothetical protein
MLQRGRGAGYLAAMQLPRATAHDLLLRCITNDPRWDSQVEERDDYYASLIVATHMDLGPFEEHLRLNDDQDQSGSRTPLTVTTLGAVARRGEERAATILTGYIRYGQWWDWAVDEIHRAGFADYSALAGAVAAHFPEDSDLREEIPAYYLDEEPWTTLAAEEDRIARAVAELRALGRMPSKEDALPWWKLIMPDATSEADLAAVPVADLLRYVPFHYPQVAKLVEQRATDNDEAVLLNSLSSSEERVVAVCIRGLGRLASQTASQAIVDFVRHREDFKGVVLNAARRAVTHIPSSFILPLGREWFQSPGWALRRLGEEVLAQHGTGDDFPLLREAIGQAMAEDDMYRLCNALDACTRLTRGCPEIEAAFTDAQYSRARSRAAKGLQAASNESFARTFARECLWDCEPETRMVGCESVPTDVPSAKERLAQMAADRCEEDHVREHARSRLGD